MRLTWQGVTLVLGTLAAAVAALRTVADWKVGMGRIVVGLHAIEHGCVVDADGNIYMPGDAAEGDYPDREA